MYGSSISSGLKTADGIIRTGKCILTDVLIGTNGTNAVTLILYDNASAASGNVLFKGQVVGANLAGEFTGMNVRGDLGIYADVTGTGAEFVVHTK